MSKIKCFRCKGTGIKRRADIGLGILTLGLSVPVEWLFAPADCPACCGHGWIED